MKVKEISELLSKFADDDVDSFCMDISLNSSDTTGFATLVLKGEKILINDLVVTQTTNISRDYFLTDDMYNLNLANG